ncbi:MAG: twin-arginine translocase subunit TatC [Gammaproteobacteria bacterium]
MTPPEPDEDLSTQSFISHLAELRARLLRGLAAVVLVTASLLYFANDLYALVARPLIEKLPQGSTMIATEVASPFFAPLKLTLVVAVFVAVPYLLHQAWAFIAPGLYRHERRLALPLLFASTLLFYAGAAFAYWVVFPVVFGFFTATAPEGVAIMTDISKYLDFILTMFLAFGIAFQVPILTVLSVYAGMTTRERLARLRPHVIVAAFVIGMVLTPPDVVSQTMMAVPMWLLFELGMLVLLIAGPKAKPGEESPDY